MKFVFVEISALLILDAVSVVAGKTSMDALFL